MALRVYENATLAVPPMLGGAYLITPRFSIGGTASVAFSYTRSETRGSGGSGKSWAYHGSVPGLSFAATVYF